MRPRGPRTALAWGLALAVLLCPGCARPRPVHPAGAAIPSLPAVSPPPGAALPAAPDRVQVRLPGGAPAAASLQVLDTTGADRGEGPVRVEGGTVSRLLPALPPGLYTVLWSADGASGASTFTIWAGGPLPPATAAAAEGAPGLRAPGPWARAAAGLALGGLLVLTGAGLTAVGHRRAVPLRAAALAAGLGAAATAWLLAARAVGTDPAGLAHSPLARPVLLRGAVLDDLLAAALAAGALASARLPRLAGAAGAAGLAALLAGVPALRAAGPPAVLAAWVAAVGAGLYAGSWPLELGGARPPAAPPRLAGLAALAGGGLPLWLLGQPAWGLPVALTTAVAVGLGRPGVRRPALLAACSCGLAGLVLLAAGLVAPAPAAARLGLPHATRWTYRVAAADGAGELAAARLQPGVYLLRLTAPAARGAVLAATASSPEYPGLDPSIPLWRVAPGVYLGWTDALALPASWTLRAAGAEFPLTLGRPAPTTSCPPGFVGLDAAEARLPAPARALAADPGDGDLALAATGDGIFATRDGGWHWQAVGGPHDAVSVAVAPHGEWYAGTGLGLVVSQDGGEHWAPVPGISGSVHLLAAPLYPAGVPSWAVAGETLHRMDVRPTAAGLASVWSAAGSAPAGTQALLPLIEDARGRAVFLLAAGPFGLALSADQGRHWQPAPAPAAAVSALAEGAGSLWAGGPGGLWTAPGPAGPWTAVALPPLGGTGPAAAASPAAVAHVATGGPDGRDVLVAGAGGGLWYSADGGQGWTAAGCPDLRATALAGTFSRWGPQPPPDPSQPVAYLADAAGRVYALRPAGQPPASAPP